MTSARYRTPTHDQVEITWPDGNVTLSVWPIQAADVARRFAATGVVPAPYAPLAIDLVAYAADRRWRREVAGITLAGVPIATDDRSKLMIMGARLSAQADAEWSTVWIGADGNAYPIDAAAIVAISDAVAEHVNECFTTFVEVKAAITAGTVTTTEQVNAAFVA